jgi:predicted SpoU family rRNA methylase
MPLVAPAIAAPQISAMQYQSNILKMTVMWSCCSFVSYLLVFMNKYFEGSLFTNNYIEGVAGIMAAAVGGRLYTRYGMKFSF